MKGVQVIYFGTGRVAPPKPEDFGQTIEWISQGHDLGRAPEVANYPYEGGEIAVMSGQVDILAGLVSDGFIGKARRHLQVRQPNGQAQVTHVGEIRFPEIGMIVWADFQLALSINLRPEYLGLYWLELVLNGQVVSRFPYFIFAPVPPDAS